MTNAELIATLQSIIIESNEVPQDNIMSKEREGLLKKYGIDEIKQMKGDDQRYYVRIPDISYANGFKTIKAYTKEEIFTKLEQYDKDKDGDPHGKTFKEWFLIWKNRQEVGKKRDPKTIEKYRTQYERVFSGTKIESWYMSEIDAEDLESFILARYKEKKIPRKACKNINCMVRGMFKYAKIKRVVDEVTTEFVDWETIVAQCDDKKKDESWKAITEDDEAKFQKAIRSKFNRDPNSLVPYCAMFVQITGVRAGEGVAIKLSDIGPKSIAINKSEKFVRLKGKPPIYYIGDTKTKKHRDIPITEEVSAIIEEVLRIRQRCNLNSEFLFCRTGGITEWISTGQVRDWLKNNGCKCMQAMRATLSSKLKNNGVSPYVVSSLLGHSVRVNEINYSPNIISIEEKRMALSKKKQKTV